MGVSENVSDIPTVCNFLSLTTKPAILWYVRRQGEDERVSKDGEIVLPREKKHAADDD